MSIFRSGGSQPASTPNYTGLQIQTAVSALPIPIVWGTSKLAPNVIWYANFKATPVSSGGGGGGKGLFHGGSSGGGSTGQYDYKADVILAMCEGPIQGVGLVWRGQSTTALGALGLSLFLGATPQAVWSYLSTPAATSSIVGILAGIQPTLGEAALLGQVALSYQGTAYVAAAQYDLSSSATLDNHNFEVNGFRYATGYGQTPYTDVPGTTAIFVDADPALVVSDFLTNAQYGVGFPAASIDATSLFGSGGDASYQTYCRAVGLAFSPALTNAEAASSVLNRWLQVTNTAAVWSGGLLRFIPYGDTAVTGNGVTFNPNVTPIYDLGDNDYIVENSADPLTVSRTDPYEAYNVWRVECADRANAYNLTPVEARDQNAIELTSQNLGGGRGERIAPTVTAHEICDPGVALIAAQLMLQRAVYIRNTYKFRLSWEYCLLDPMDLVTVSDAVLGLDKAPIRITAIEENENGYLEITAEEFPLGYATATKYATTSVINVPNDRNVDPGSVADVLIFEPTDELGGGLVIMAGACSTNPLWGGCNIWLSYQEDGNYSQIGAVKAGARIGITTADLPAVGVSVTGQTIDQVNTLAVDLTESAGVLASGTQADAAALNNRCYVGGEIVSYQTATLTAANKYNLSYLVRGAYGTEDEIVDHPAGSKFARLDGAFFSYPYAQSRIGDTVYLKFQSFNVYGGGTQSLADCTAFAYTITGAALASPLPDVTDLYTNYEAGFQKIYWDEVSDFRNGILYEIRQGAIWDAAQFIRSQAHPPFIAQGNGTFLIKARCQPVAGLTVYSENAAAIAISGNQLSLNLLAGFDEKATGWTGSFDNGVGVDGSGDLRLGGAGNILAANPLLQSAATSTATASGNVLSFAYLPPNVAVGMAVADTTTASVIGAGATVQEIDYNAANLDFGSVAAAPSATADYGAVTTAATVDIDYGAVTGTTCTVKINPAVAGGGVLSGDTIVFSVADVLDYGGVITGTPAYYTIPASHIINAGSVVQASVNGSTQIVGVPVGQNILSVADFLNDPDVLGSASTQYVDGWIEIALSQDGSNFGPWQKFVPGVFPAAAWDFRLALLSNDPNTIPTALAFNYTVQLPSRIDHYQNQSVPSGGLTILFKRDGTAALAQFNGGPGSGDLPYVSVSWPPTAGDQYSISALSLSQLTIRFSNGGSFVARSNVNITVEGF
jgi:Putative phage tail protein